MRKKTSSATEPYSCGIRCRKVQFRQPALMLSSRNWGLTLLSWPNYQVYQVSKYRAILGRNDLKLKWIETSMNFTVVIYFRCYRWKIFGKFFSNNCQFSTLIAFHSFETKYRLELFNHLLQMRYVSGRYSTRKYKILYTTSSQKVGGE